MAGGAVDGKVEGRLKRIPYEINQGLINRLRENPQPGDPPDELLEQFMKNIPAANG